MEKPKSKLAGLDKTKSFKQKKKIQKGSRGYGLKQIARMTLGSGNMQLAVELPAGEDLNEWLAVNTIEFYNEINVLYGILTEFCTAEVCPTMSAGPKYEYLWADGHNVKTPLKVSAAEYIDFLMTWVENQLNNEKIFPCQLGVPFPKNFINIIKVIFKRLFRVYAHIYHTHFQHIMLLSAETHLNTCFKHFIYFIDQFNLVDAKELAPLAELIQQFKERKNERIAIMEVPKADEQDQLQVIISSKKKDIKQKKPKADLSDTGVVNDQGFNSLNEGQEDSFQRMYSKELDLDEGTHISILLNLVLDEVPIILHELNDSAIHFISRDQYERALSLLQKAQTLIDRLQFQKNPNDRFIVLLTMHNMALCFQKLGALEECALCLEASLQTINSPFLIEKFQGDPSKKLKKLKYECKAHMQVCALLSQLHRHKEAVRHAEMAVMISQYMITDLHTLCQHYHLKVILAKKNEQIAQELMAVNSSSEDPQQILQKELIYYDDSVSMLERTAFRIYPIIQEVNSRMINTNSQKKTKIGEYQKEINSGKFSSGGKFNMKSVLGYLNQSEWLYLLNIGNIMQITPLTVHDMYSSLGFEVELTRDSILEKISFLAVSYFCMSTELRFLVQIKDDPSIDPALKKRESEYWHAKALEISCSFLPSECPLVTHILTSYQKHHAPVSQEIPEDRETDFKLKVIRPLPGIDVCKFQPMVRQDESLNITIPILPLSPNNYASLQKRQNTSQDYKYQQNMFSPEPQPMSAVSGGFSTQVPAKQHTTETSSTLNNKPSSRLPNQQQRFNKNKNAVVPNQQQRLQQQYLMNKLNDSSDGIDSDSRIIEVIQTNAMDESILDTDQNKSMMDVMPSANYKKLLNDISAIQNSSEVIEEHYNDDGASDEDQQLFEDIDEEGDEISHEESQEVAMVLNKISKQHKTQAQLGGPKQRDNRVEVRVSNQNQILDISQDVLDDDEYEDEVDLNRTQEENEDIGGNTITNKSLKAKHNLSMDQYRKVKRPQTSQGIRKAKTKQQQLEDLNRNTTMRQKSTEQSINTHDQKLIKTTSALHVLPQSDGVSPNNGDHAQHNSKKQKSSLGANSKLTKYQTVGNGFNMNQSSVNNGALTDLKGNSTPIKHHSIAHQTGFGGKSNLENINMSRANLDTNNQQRTNQSSHSELTGGRRSASKSKRQQRAGTNAGVDGQNVGKRNANISTQALSSSLQQQILANNTRSQSQQRKYLTNSSQKQKSSMQEINYTQSQISKQQQQQQELGRQTLNEMFMGERLNHKKRQGGGIQMVSATTAQESQNHNRSFEMADSKYNSQNLSNSRSKQRGKASGSSRSKEKVKQQQQVVNTNIEELKRQILIKQALIDSNKSTRRKSAGGITSGSASQIQTTVSQKKRLDNANNLSLRTTQQQMTLSQQPSTVNQQQWLSSQLAQQQSIPSKQESKQNTHQLIKRFLKVRQFPSNNSSQIMQINNSMLENYASAGSQQDLSQINKQQLSQKIMQQQQQLLGAANLNKSKRQGDSYATQIHPKRSATPIIDLEEGQSRTNVFNNPQQMSYQQVSVKIDKNSLQDIGNFQARQHILKDYMYELQNQSLREDSTGKPGKKKGTKKITPKNIMAVGGQFNWM